MRFVPQVLQFQARVFFCFLQLFYICNLTSSSELHEVVSLPDAPPPGSSHHVQSAFRHFSDLRAEHSISRPHHLNQFHNEQHSESQYPESQYPDTYNNPPGPAPGPPETQQHRQNANQQYVFQENFGTSQDTSQFSRDHRMMDRAREQSPYNGQSQQEIISDNLRYLNGNVYALSNHNMEYPNHENHESSEFQTEEAVDVRLPESQQDYAEEPEVQPSLHDQIHLHQVDASYNQEQPQQPQQQPHEVIEVIVEEQRYSNNGQHQHAHVSNQYHDDRSPINYQKNLQVNQESSDDKQEPSTLSQQYVQDYQSINEHRAQMAAKHHQDQSPKIIYVMSQGGNNDNLKYTESKDNEYHHVTDGNQHVTDGNQHVTDGNHHVTNGNHHVTDGNHHVTDGNHHVTDGNHHVTNGNHHVTDGNHHVTDGNHHVTDGNHHVTDGNHHVTDGNHHVTDGNHHVTDGNQHVADGNHHVYNGDHQVTDGNQHVADGNHHVYNGDHQVSNGDHHVTNGDHHVTNGNHHVTNGNHHVTNGNHHVYNGDHQLANVNHQLASVNHQLASGNHQVSNGNPQVSNGNHQVSNGNHQVSNGNHQVSNGNHQVSNGNHQVSNGNHQVSNGNHQVSNGNHQVSNGNHQVSNGNHQVSNGNHQVSNGNHQVSNPNHQVYNGNQPLSNGNYQVTSGNHPLSNGIHHVSNANNHAVEINQAPSFSSYVEGNVQNTPQHQSPVNSQVYQYLPASEHQSNRNEAYQRPTNKNQESNPQLVYQRVPPNSDPTQPQYVLAEIQPGQNENPSLGKTKHHHNDQIISQSNDYSQSQLQYTLAKDEQLQVSPDNSNLKLYGGNYAGVDYQEKKPYTNGLTQQESHPSNEKNVISYPTYSTSNSQTTSTEIEDQDEDANVRQTLPNKAKAPVYVSSFSSPTSKPATIYQYSSISSQTHNYNSNNNNNTKASNNFRSKPQQKKPSWVSTSRSKQSSEKGTTPNMMFGNGAIPGEPGKDYPIYSSIPKNPKLSCRGKSAGFYSDVQHGCQVYYQCSLSGDQQGFLCPNGTLFNQISLVCEWWYNVDCKASERHFDKNKELYQQSEDSSDTSEDEEEDHSAKTKPRKSLRSVDSRTNERINQYQRQKHFKDDMTPQTSIFVPITAIRKVTRIRKPRRIL